MRRRSTLEIRIEILENAREKIKPTRLMYDSNLSWIPLQAHLNELKKKGYIEEIELDKHEIRKDKRTAVIYRTTISGANIVRTFSDVKKSVV